MKKKISWVLSFLTVFVLIFSNIGNNKFASATEITTHYDDEVVGTANLNGTSTNSAKFCDRLTAPEIGWKRYDDTNSKIQYIGDWFHTLADAKGAYYKDTFSSEKGLDCRTKIYMVGQKIRIIVPLISQSTVDTMSKYENNADVYADGTMVGHMKTIAVISPSVNQAIGFEYSFSTYGKHTIEIVSRMSASTTVMGSLGIDAVDVDGELVDYTSTTVPFYRYYNGGDHFYTTDYNELGSGKDGYILESIACHVYATPLQGTVPLYRYFDGGNHFYSTNYDELGDGKYGYKLDGIQCYVYPSPQPGTIPLYRYYNGIHHFYTTDYNELGSGKYGLTLEAIQCYVLP